MKFRMFMAAMVALVLQGCSTATMRNTAKNTIVTSPDGTVTETRFAENKVNALGNDAVKQTINRSLADATADDLSAGIGSTDQSAQSTEFIKLGNNLITQIGNIGTAFFKSQEQNAVPTVSMPSQQVSTQVASGAPNTIKGVDGSPTIVVLGNRLTCSRCRTVATWFVELSSALCDATIFDADEADNPDAFRRYRPSTGFEFPYVVVYNGGGEKKGGFTAKNMTKEVLIAECKKYLPDECSTGVE